MRYSGSILLFVCSFGIPLSASDIVLKDGLAMGPLGRFGRSLVQADPIEAQIVLGTWRPPRAGDEVRLPDDAVRNWEALVADGDGLFKSPSLGGGYVYFTVASETQRVMILDAAGHSLVYVNGELRAGDPYSNGIVRLPIALREGDNSLLFLVARGQLRARLIDPRSAAQLDLSDSTLPDAIVGQPIEHWGAVPVVNAASVPLTDALLEVTLPDGSARTTPLPGLLGCSSRKVAFRMAGPAPGEAGEVEVRLRLLRGPAREELDSAVVKLRVVTPEQTHKRTFLSAIDGSVQYFGVAPAKPATAGDPPPALILSLHGAGVEAIGQAQAYLQKDWAHVVAPTNRRPYGFDWEDWGRLDAMEVLDLARQQLRQNSGATYLTGHSMGGHGAWQIAAHFPDRFLAVGPSAGWVSMFSYAGLDRRNEPTPVEKILSRAAAPSDTLALARNLAQLGVYILHGEKDDNVPVREARTMKGVLEEFHPDFRFHEEPGMGHWWGKEGIPGTACVDWPPMWDYFRNRDSHSDGIPELNFTTVNPGISAWCHWIGIEAQRTALVPSKIHARWEGAEPRLTVTTDNVARLVVDLRPFPAIRRFRALLDDQEIAAVDVDAAEQRVWLRRDPATQLWSVTNSPPASQKGSHRNGPFKDAFRNRMLFVYGTRGDSRENAWAIAKARYDAETFWYRGNGSIDILADEDYVERARELADRSVILYGNADTNSSWPALLAGSPIEVRRDFVRLGADVHRSDSLACFFLQPHPASDIASIAVISGTGANGLRLADRVPLFLSGVAIPDFLVLDPRSLLSGRRGIAHAGFFGSDWAIDSGELVSAEP